MILHAKTVLAVLIFVASFDIRASRNLTRFEFHQNHMGTQFNIVMYADRNDLAVKASNAAFARVAELNSRYSDYRDESELNELCRTAADRPVRVSEDLFLALSLSSEWSELTGGAFDITAAPVIRLWRRARRIKEIPDQDDLRKARTLVGYRQLQMDQKARTVRFARSGMQLDLGGIAKGIAADEALAVLARDGIDRALVAAGGDVVAGEAPPDSPGWVVGVAPFLASQNHSLTRLVLRHAAVSTSGDAEQHLEIEGIRYSHIIDPRTGMAIIGAGSVTVVARKGSISDPAATALSVLGPDNGLQLVDSRLSKFGPLAAIFVQVENGKIATRESQGWKKMMKYE